MADAAAIDLSPDHRRIVLAILSRHLAPGSVWAFGSRVRGVAKRYSDLDLAVVTEAPVQSATLAELEEAFSRSDLPWRVDVIDWASTGEAFRKIVQSELTLLF